MGLPKGAFSVEVAETFMRCDTQNMWSVLGTSYSVKLTRKEGVRIRLVVVGRGLDSVYPLYRIR